MKIGKAEDVGAAYVFENMSDEGKRIIDEESGDIKIAERRMKTLKGTELEFEKQRIAEKKKTLGLEKKIKAAEIIKVDLIDRDGKEISVLQTGDDVSIRISFTKNEKLKEINLGIGLYKDDGGYVFGYNTQMDSFSVPSESKIVTLSFKSMPLLAGNYFLRGVCFGEFEEQYFDFKNKAKIFQVFPTAQSNRYRGAVNIDHQWK